MSSLISYRAAALHLGIEMGTLYAWVARKRIPHIRFGPRCVRFDVRDLDAWIKEHIVKTGQSMGYQKEEL